MIHKAHIIKLSPTKNQEILLKKSCGVARYSYNWALTKWKLMYESGEKPSAYTLIKLQNKIKREVMPFFMEVSKNAPQYAIHNLSKAFKSFFDGYSNYPSYKKKGNTDSYLAVENKEEFYQDNFRIYIPKIGKIKCFENLRFKGKVNNVVIKRIAEMWFAIVNIEVENIPIETPSGCDNQVTVGVDMGIKSMMVLSNGTVYENPMALRSNIKTIKRLQRGLSRKQTGSRNHRKQQMKIAKKHYRISCLRLNAINLATTEIVRNSSKIVIESLKPLNMVKNRKLSQAVSDVSFGEIARQLSYKAMWAGKEIVKADTWFASSKICSGCGHKKIVLKLSERIYQCENCGLKIDRDLNAAINLANYRPTSELEGCKACGDGSSCPGNSPSMNQEVFIKDKLERSHEVLTTDQLYNEYLKSK